MITTSRGGFFVSSLAANLEQKNQARMASPMVFSTKRYHPKRWLLNLEPFTNIMGI